MKALLMVLWMAAPAAAQVDVGAGFGPEAFLQGERGGREETPVLPLGLAASLAFDATTWTAVAVSTVPALDLTILVKRGYYKLELLQSVLLASRAKVSLKEIVTAHDKGKSMRDLAQAKQVDFDALYEEALRLDEEVVGRLLPSIMTVSTAMKNEAPPAAGHAPPAEPKAQKPRREKKP